MSQALAALAGASLLAGAPGAVLRAQAESAAYVPVVRQEWSAFKDDAALKAAHLIGPESAGLLAQPPQLAIEQLFELVPDPLWGQVVRYKGGPFANSASPRLPPRVPMHVAHFPDLRNVWIRQYIRFSPNWTTAGPSPPGGVSYKAMFIRWNGVGFRMGFLINGFRELVLEHGHAYENGKNYPATSVRLPWQNTVPISVRDGIQGPDGFPMFRGMSLARLPTGPGNGEWYEVIMHHRQAREETAEGTLAFRQFTSKGKIAPGRWLVLARSTTFSRVGDVWHPANSYRMGVNRNKWFAEEMHIDWGPYEVVDGSRYPNPWNTPFQ